MGRVEDMLAVSCAKVLAIYPTDDPVFVETASLNKENHRLQKKKAKKLKKMLAVADSNKSILLKTS